MSFIKTFSNLRPSRVAFLLLASTAAFTAGCSNMATTATGVSSVGDAAVVVGHVHGGNQPISFSTVTLNYAGASGQGSIFPGTANNVIATTTSAADGSWSFTRDSNNGDSWPASGNIYSCPNTSYNPLVYLVAKGGNTQGTGDSTITNNAAVFVAPLGPCRNISNSTFINLDEVSTVATIAALQQYFDPVNETFGAGGSGLAYTYFLNAFNLIPNMVNLSSGRAITSSNIPGGSLNLSNGVAAVSVTATPETAKINTLANILASCVNSSSASATNCTTLFSNATPPVIPVTSRPYGTAAFNPATDILQATYYMLTNPTNGSATNLGNLYLLPVGAGAAYQPSLTTAPSDWTIGISYSTTSTCGTNSGSFIGSPYSLSVDVYGNLWMANSQGGSGNLTEISPSGIPIVCVALNSPATSPSTTAASTIDSAGNVWQGASGTPNLTRYVISSQAALSFPTPEAPLALAADGKGNVYFTTVTGHLYQIAGAASATAAVTPVEIATALGTPSSLLVDNTSSQAIWASSGTGSLSRTIATNIGSSPGYLNGFSTSVISTSSPTYGLAVKGASGNNVNNLLFSLQGTTNAVSNIIGSSTSYSAVANFPTAAGFAGISLPTGIASDAQTNIWIANNANSSGLGSVSEVSASAAALSLSTGFQKSATFLNSSRSVAIDQVGNVWVGGDGNAFVTQIVGAAVPVYQPFAQAINTPYFQSIP
jgi:hypothetical protein